MKDTNLDDTSTAFLFGSTGLGTSAARLASELAKAARVGNLDPRLLQADLAPAGDLDPAYAERSWGDGTASPLYCPITERFNEPLADEVDDRLAAWALECGFDEDEVEKIRKVRFGRLVMLAHPDCDDPDRLLIGAKLNMAWWAADDYYADDSELGADPMLLPPRLLLAMTAMDRPPPAGEFTPPLEEAIAEERVLVAFGRGIDYLAQYATPEQVQRTCYAPFSMFVSWGAYAAWRYTGEYPPAWKYLAARQHDSFYTSMTLIDPIGGYVLPADLGCSIKEATEITVKFHNDLVHDFRERHQKLQDVPNVELQRFLRGLRGWMGGAFEWHNSNPRYKNSNGTPQLDSQSST